MGGFIRIRRAGDLIESNWPDQIDFVNEEECNAPPYWDWPNPDHRSCNCSGQRR